jgi:hypothetical protein
MASNEKSLVPLCTHAVGLQLDDVGHSMLDDVGYLLYAKVPWTPYLSYFNENVILNCIIGDVGILQTHMTYKVAITMPFIIWRFRI